MKKIFIIAGMMVASVTYAQNSSNGYLGNVGINTTTPGATLDVNVSKSTSLDKTYGQGIAFPRVKRSTLNAMSKDIVLSSMVYVENVDTTSSIDRTVDVDAVGYYFFNGTKWTKLGGGAASTAAETDTFTRAIRSDNRTTVVVDQLEDGKTPTKDYYIIMTGSPSAVTMPSPANNKGRVICLYNPGGNTAVLSPDSVGPQSGGVGAGGQSCFISDSVNWYNLGGY